MQHSNFQCLSKRNKAQRDACLKSTEVKEVDIYVLDEKGLVALWVSEQKKRGLTNTQIDEKSQFMKLAAIASARGSLIHDFKNFYLLAEDLKKGGSILGKYEITKNGAKSYITFKGNHKLRSLIKGTRYLSGNAKVLALGIGKAGMKASAKTGVLMTIIYSVPFRTLELALNKNYLITNWIMNISSDVIKAAISAVFGYTMGAISFSGGVILVPIFVGIAAAFVAGELLTSFEGRYLVKEKIIDLLNNFIETRIHEDIDNRQHVNLSRKAIQQLRTSTHGVNF